MVRAAVLMLTLYAFSPIADAPVLEWRLIPVEWVEVNLCLKPCMYKASFVSRYEWRAE